MKIWFILIPVNQKITIEQKMNGCKVPISTKLNLSFPYDWSNPDIDEETLIYIILEKTIFSDLVKIMIAFGVKRVMWVFEHNHWDPLTHKILSRMLQNAQKGLQSD